MPYDGFGVFTRSYNWVADQVANIKIQAARMDAEFDNYATALNQVLLRSGVAPMEGALKLGGNNISGLNDGSAATPALTFEGDTATGFYQPSAGVIGFSVLGTERGRFTNTGFEIVGVQKITGSLSISASAPGVPRTALDVAGITSIRGVFEDTTYSATGISGTVQVDVKTQAVVLYDTNAAGNWTFNIRGDGATSLDSIMAIGQSLTLAIEVPQGVTAYYCTAITVDGVAPSQLKWFNGGAPLIGNASGIDVYCITVYKKAAGTFYVRASQAQAK